MAEFNFPDSPTINQTYTFAGVTWKWNGAVWKKVTELVGSKGDKGIKGDKGNKGDTSDTGGKGHAGEKGGHGK